VGRGPGAPGRGRRRVPAQRQARITLASGGTRVVPIDSAALAQPRRPRAGARQIAVNLPDEEVAAVEVLIDGERLVVPPEVLAH
jgi:hypothetical protein